MLPEIAVVNVLGYVIAMLVVAIAFGLLRLLFYKVPSVRVPPAQEVSQAEGRPAPIPGALPVEVIAAAVVAVHEHLRKRIRRAPSPAHTPLARPFISYWVLSERMNPAFQEIAHVRERGAKV